jgi:hypothetical protein
VGDHCKQQAIVIHTILTTYVTVETMTHAHITFVTQNKLGSSPNNFSMLHRLPILTIYTEALHQKLKGIGIVADHHHAATQKELV